MRKWLSPLIYIVIALIAVVISLPPILGFLAESRCKKIVEIINSTTPLSAKITKYKRGWFSAKAKAEISLDKLDLKNKELYRAEIVATIGHGPMIIDWARFYFAQAVINANIKLNDEQNRLLKHNNAPIATSNIKIKLNGNTRISLNSIPLVYQNEEKGKSCIWKGLKIAATFSPLYNETNSHIEFAGIEIEDKERTISFGEVTSNLQAKKSSGDLWLGKRDLHIESFVSKSIYNRIIELEKVKIISQAKESKENSVNMESVITIGNMNINGGMYTQNKLDLDINYINQKAFSSLLQQITSKKILISPTSLGFDILMTLLNNGTEIDMKRLNTNTPWGRAIAKLKVTFPDQAGSLGLLSIITNISIDSDIKIKHALALHLLEKFYQNIPSSKKDKNSAEKAKNLLEEWQKSGKITTEEDSGYLNINFDYKNNQMFINNKPLTLTTQL